MWDLVPGPGIEPVPPALGAQSLTHWTTREVPPRLFMSLSPILHLFEAHFRGQWFPNCTPQHPRTLAAPAGHHERARISWGDAAKLSLCPRSCTTALSWLMASALDHTASAPRHLVKPVGATTQSKYLPPYTHSPISMAATKQQTKKIIIITLRK